MTVRYETMREACDYLLSGVAKEEESSIMSNDECQDLLDAVCTVKDKLAALCDEDDTIPKPDDDDPQPA